VGHDLIQLALEHTSVDRRFRRQVDLCLISRVKDDRLPRPPVMLVADAGGEQDERLDAVVFHAV
jgi:hypothetical protein